MNSLQGQLLIAAPQFVGSSLPRAVVLVTEHTAAGAQGVVLNHPVNEQLLRTCFELWQQGKTPKIALDMIQATPVSQPTTTQLQPTQEVLPPEEATDATLESPAEDADTGLPAVPNSPDRLPVGVLMAPAAADRLGKHLPPAFRVVVGQVGWSPDQLTHDLATGQWLTTPATPDLIFGIHDNLWQTAVKRVGACVLFESLGIVPSPKSELN